MSATVPRHEVVVKRTKAAKARAQRFAPYLGQTYTLASTLYPRRRNQRCTVVSANYAEDRAPLVVQWPDGARGIADPEQLTPVTGGQHS